jgi:uncharacterized repeat protein (TIGR03803 family)
MRVLRTRHFLALVITLMLPGALAAQTSETLYSFNGTSDGNDPLSSLVADASGNLYGTTFVGGPSGAGEVYELTPTPTGEWTETILYGFTGGTDGANPYYADVIFDTAGNLYGTTVSGGANNFGTVFKLAPTVNGWVESVIYSFGGGADGQNPYAGLLFDTAGNLYGTTNSGGAYGVGTVFELSPQAGGQWSERVLFTFDNKHGSSPVGGLVFNKHGHLLGAASSGGTRSNGVIYELAPQKDGSWTEKVLHNFTGGHDGGFPWAERLLIDANGHIYGTTQGGGALSAGTVFKLSPNSDGSWTESVLYSFDPTVLSNPYSGLTFDASGNLVGTCANGNGTTTVGGIFQLTKTKAGKWDESNLFLFSGANGEFPESALLLDQSGNLYGTTFQGGVSNSGVVFKVTP